MSARPTETDHRRYGIRVADNTIHHNGTEARTDGSASDAITPIPPQADLSRTRRAFRAAQDALEAAAAAGADTSDAWLDAIAALDAYRAAVHARAAA